MCEKQGVIGKNVTPFVLSEVSRVTKGVSMESSKSEQILCDLDIFVSNICTNNF